MKRIMNRKYIEIWKETCENTTPPIALKRLTTITKTLVKTASDQAENRNVYLRNTSLNFILIPTRSVEVGSPLTVADGRLED
jgi:hypothetical protein